MMLLDFQEKLARALVFMILERLGHGIKMLGGFDEAPPRSDHSRLIIDHGARPANQRFHVELRMISIRSRSIARPGDAIRETKEAELPCGGFDPGKRAHM
jgi:hypothetical protein